ncbi:hypothetical protein [Cryobacterium ruanii]|uniref:Antitoxin VbhA domain-containing protein n=1 Tax=Cryobacterium ruanii TaxID=1259197 RepID=A0A4R9ARV2_9MICO|nr:hypothetical protein [Cryobacterium ruanii]TFD67982.1 hypothetical protein E3T47_05155 [Cryobacterium ruanii]
MVTDYGASTPEEYARRLTALTAASWNGELSGLPMPADTREFAMRHVRGEISMEELIALVKGQALEDLRQERE